MCAQMTFISCSSAADTQPLVELVLEARAEVIVNVTDVDSLVILSLSDFTVLELVTFSVVKDVSVLVYVYFC